MILHYTENKTEIETAIRYKVEYNSTDLKYLNGPIGNTFRVDISRNINKVEDDSIFGRYETNSVKEIRSLFKKLISFIGYRNLDILFINDFKDSFKGIWLGDNFNAKKYAKMIFNSFLEEEPHPKLLSETKIRQMDAIELDKLYEEYEWWFYDYFEMIADVLDEKHGRK